MSQKTISVNKDEILKEGKIKSVEDVNELEDILNFLAPRILDVKKKLANGELELNPEFEVERGNLDEICQGLGITNYLAAWISSERVHTKE